MWKRDCKLIQIKKNKSVKLWQNIWIFKKSCNRGLRLGESFLISHNYSQRGEIDTILKALINVVMKNNNTFVFDARLSPSLNVSKLPNYKVFNCQIEGYKFSLENSIFINYYSIVSVHDFCMFNMFHTLKRWSK